MARKRFAAVLTALATMTGAALTGAGPAQAASPRCSDGTPSICLTALAVTPATVDTNTGGQLTVTATTAAGSPALSCLRVYWQPSDQFPEQIAEIKPVNGSTTKFSGPLTWEAGIPTGTYQVKQVIDCNNTHGWFQLGAAGGLKAPVTVNGTNDTSKPQLQSLTVSATSFDTTSDAARVTVRARITDTGSGVRTVSPAAVYTRDASAHPASVPSGEPAASSIFERVSGTSLDGTYEGIVYLTEGTRGAWALSLQVSDIRGNILTLTSAQLAARGLPSSLTTRTTAAPAKPSLTATVIYPGTWQPTIDGSVTGTLPATSPVATNWVVVNAPAVCGKAFPATDARFPGLRFVDHAFLRSCTVTLRVANAAGVSPEASVSYR